MQCCCSSSADRSCLHSVKYSGRCEGSPELVPGRQQDLIINPDTQRFMAERIKSKFRSHAVDHAPSSRRPALSWKSSVIHALAAITWLQARENSHYCLKYRSSLCGRLEYLLSRGGASDAPALLCFMASPKREPQFLVSSPLLADRFHTLFAPRSAGFGQSEMPAEPFQPTRSNHIAGVIDRFTEVIGLNRFAIYVSELMARRQASDRPKIPTAYRNISQNGTAYVRMGLRLLEQSAYWPRAVQANRAALRPSSR